MKKHIFLIGSIALTLLVSTMTGCSSDETDFSDENTYPSPKGGLTSSANIVAIYGQTATVTGKIESRFGIRDIYATLLTGSEGQYVEIDKNNRIAFDFGGEPESVDFSIDIPVVSENATAIKVVGLSAITKTVERIVAIDRIFHKPVISFTGDKDTRNTVCIGIPFRVSGNAVSDCKVSSVSFIPVVNGVNRTSVSATVTGENEAEYSGMVPVEAGLERVIVRAENIHGGFSEKTYTVLNVVSQDFVVFEVAKENDVLKNIIAGETNTLSASVSSGSDLVSLTYSIKTSGTYGPPISIEIPQGTENELDFMFELNVPATGMEAVRFEAKNSGNTTENQEYAVVPTRRAAVLRNVEMSTDMADNACFLALYETEKVFGRDVALTKQNRIDWVLNRNGTQAQPISPHAYGAGTSYYNNSKDYLWNFTELTYMFLSALRGNIVKADIDKVVTDYEIDMYIRDVIVPGYNVLTASRRVGDNWVVSGAKSTGGFLIGWGSHTHPNTTPAVVSNVAFGLVWVNSVTMKANGHYLFNFDIIYPSTDQRAANNTSSIVPYDPYPLN